jgi:hypothetical protein
MYNLKTKNITKIHETMCLMQFNCFVKLMVIKNDVNLHTNKILHTLK